MTRQDELLSHRLDLPLSPRVLETYSTIVMQYFDDEERRFHVFVANWVTEIRSRSNPSDCHHVPRKRIWLTLAPEDENQKD